MSILPREELRLSITSACNMKCDYCHNEGNLIQATMSSDTIFCIVSDLIPLGLKKVRITGGEPLVHPDIESICQTLSEKYGLEIGINTNGILLSKLITLINCGYINRVVIGLDFYDAPISKRSSIGVPSSEILGNVLKIKATNTDVCIDVVYDGNDENIENLIDWAITHHIRIKIIEEVALTPPSNNIRYDVMVEKMIEKFKLCPIVDALGEINGYRGNFRAVSFFHSFCRIRACDKCVQLPIRVNSEGVIKGCLLHNSFDYPINLDTVSESFINMLQTPINCRGD